MNTIKTLSAIKGLTEAKINKIRECAAKIHESGFVTGTNDCRQAAMHRNNGNSKLP
jgi:hypothetical protein